ncbi:MAG: PhzF family phenazine biosynthesis protein [Mesorhizobium sp.]
MPRPFQLVDVFGVAPFSGNPLAVVAGAEGLSTDEMQAITRWLNLSETAFLLAPEHPDADYRVRIFTLARELPFAGHPTLGSCHAWLTGGGRPKRPGTIVQECGIGLVEVKQTNGRLAFAAPPLIRSGPVADADLAEAIDLLGLKHTDVVEARWIDNGPGWMGLMLSSAEAVLAVEPRRHHPRPIDIGLVGPHPAGSDAAFELRALFADPSGTIIEDPVTGSLNASVGQWLFESGRSSGSYVAAQGARLGRTGRIHVTLDGDGTVWVGGGTATLFSGHEGR